MARMAAHSILVLFAALAFLPGCQCFPALNHSAPVEVVKLNTAVVKPDLPALEPANRVVVESNSSSKADAAPKSAGPVFDRAYLNKNEPKKPLGTTGVVILEPPALQLTASQKAAPAVKERLTPAAKALQCLHDGKHAEALQALEAYDKSTQDLLINILPAVLIVAQTPIDKMGAQDIAMLNEVLQRWSQLIRNRTELSISKMCFCRQVNGFGAYEPLPENHAFLAGTPERYGEQVQLYVELKNFVSEPDKTGRFVTKLACSLELKNARGEKVWSHAFQRDQTTYRRYSRLNDLHANFIFPVPALAPGTYYLTMQIIDETLPNHRRVKQESLPVRVTPVAAVLP